MRARLLFALAVVLAASSAASAEDKDRPLCFSLGNEDYNYKDQDELDPDLQACSRMINSGAYKEKALAAIYRARGVWKQKKGELDAALPDYGISIHMEPDNVESYDYRADVYQEQGDLDRALEDYNYATRINPAYAAAYYSRGLIYEKKRDLDKAHTEYNSAIAAPTIDRIAQWAQDKARARLKVLAEDSDKN